MSFLRKDISDHSETKKDFFSPKYREISWTAACANPEYKQLTEHMFKEQATRVAQRAWRKKKNKTFKGRYIETLNRPLRLSY